MMREYNKYQTRLSPELVDSLTKEEQTELFDAIDSIEFLQNLIDPNRKRAKDLPRYNNPFFDKDRREEDPNGRIRVNITKPHILEDMDYFRPSAIHFEKYGCYTTLFPNRNPNSEYFKFWKKEAKRCRDGMIRESDGEWISGYNYYYWNYTPILKVVDYEGTKMADRVEGFPNPYDGDYLFYHYLELARNNGRHSATLKKRGSGFSFKGGSKLARNFTVGMTEIARHKVKSYAVANEREYLTKDGVLNKFVNIIDFNAENTGFPRNRSLKDSMQEMSWIMGRKDPISGTNKGTLNEVIGVTLKNDPEKARGKRGGLIEWEEAGKFDSFLKAWGIARPSVEEDGFAFGTMNAYGTGGTEGAAFEGLEEIFYNGEGYNIQSIPNVFDRNVSGRTRCSFFFGAYLNFKGHYDENGNSDVIGALIKLIKERIKTKYGASDPNTIVQLKAEKPITPQEAIMRTQGSAFPVADLRDYLEDIMPMKDKFLEEHWVGHLSYDTKGNVKWSVDYAGDLNPIREFPFKVTKGDSTGAIEIYDMPHMDPKTHEPYRNRYIAGIDPVDNDYTVGGSLASIIVFDLWTDKIVAEYTGRPVLAEEFYEQCIKLLKFYNAEANYESNLKGLFGYFSNHNSLYLLCDTPEILRDMDIVKSVLYGNRAKGTRTTKEVSKLGKTLQRQWQLSQFEMETVNKETDEPETIFVPNLRRIRSIGYIKECIAWNPDGNFDRVSAMDMVMILREDKLRMINKYDEHDVSTDNEMTGDEFLDSNWQKVVASEFDFI